jgi:hypothetical protein
MLENFVDTVASFKYFIQILVSQSISRIFLTNFFKSLGIIFIVLKAFTRFIFN